MLINRFYLVLAFVTCSLFIQAKNNKHIICIENTNKPVSEKEAIVILPGLGDGRKQRKHQQDFFCKQGFDVFIPDYIDKDGFDATYHHFEDFHSHYQLGAYQKLHVFSYILGSWTINTFIKKNGIGNIHSIVYDRSPMQELAPELIVENIPLIAKILFGKLPEDLTHMPYPSIDTSGVRIGIIVEGKATPVLRFYEKKAKQKRDFNWDEIDYQQTHHDLMYTYLNHDEMYLNLGVFGNNALHFFKHGSFGLKARRNWYGWDSFEKLPKLNTEAWKDATLHGLWHSERFYSPIIDDSVRNIIGFTPGGYSQFFLTKEMATSEVGFSPDSRFTPIKINRKKTVFRHRKNDDVHRINQLPKQDNQGRWFLIVDERIYWKIED
jgi:hypothetical protein